MDIFVITTTAEYGFPIDVAYALTEDIAKKHLITIVEKYGKDPNLAKPEDIMDEENPEPINLRDDLTSASVWLWGTPTYEGENDIYELRVTVTKEPVLTT